MAHLIAVTNRHLVPGGEPTFLAQLRRIGQAAPRALLLREKDLAENDYAALAKKAFAVCEESGIPFILHTYRDVAGALGIRRLHLPFPSLRRETETREGLAALRTDFDVLGVSVHSREEAEYAARHGATYLTAGHIFATDCKAGLAPRGLPFLAEICDSVPIPVYAIGGIDGTRQQLSKVLACRAAGVCMMSGMMTL